MKICCQKATSEEREKVGALLSLQRDLRERETQRKGRTNEKKKDIVRDAGDTIGTRACKKANLVYDSANGNTADTTRGQRRKSTVQNLRKRGCRSLRAPSTQPAVTHMGTRKGKYGSGRGRDRQRKRGGRKGGGKTNKSCPGKKGGEQPICWKGPAHEKQAKAGESR